MYGNPPIFLPPVSNREDLLLSISIYDDDTSEPVNLAGCGTASGMAFVGGFTWTVTIGSIITSSSTLITIPAFPIGNQLSALQLTVAPGLAVDAGDAIQITDTNPGNYMLGTVNSYNPVTGVIVCQIGNTFQFEIRRGVPRNDGTGYVPWYDFGTPDDSGPLISASLGDGLLVTDIGFLQILIPEATFRTLNIGTFNTALTSFDGVATRQVFIARLPVLYGGVTM